MVVPLPEVDPSLCQHAVTGEIAQGHGALGTGHGALAREAIAIPAPGRSLAGCRARTASGARSGGRAGYGGGSGAGASAPCMGCTCFEPSVTSIPGGASEST
jgi:hypothetical protein